MGILKKLYSQKQEKPLQELNRVLEIKIFKLLGQAELLLDSDPEWGIQIFRQADKLYLLRGFDIEIECQINEVYRSYLREHPSVC